MARIKGSSTKIYWQNELIGNAQDYSYSNSVDQLEVTALGDTAKSYVTGMEDGSFSANFNFDGADAQQIIMVSDNAEGWITIGLSGDSSTAPVMSGLMSIESWDITSNINDMVKLSISAKGSMTLETS